MDLAAILQPVQAPLDDVRTFLDAEFCSDHPELRELLAHVGKYKGKLLRPALVLLAGRACGGRLTPDHVAVSAIVQMIHTATLLHDDVLDEADLRRKMPSTNALWGNEITVLLGDFLYARAFSISTRLEDPMCSRILARTTQTICRGEIAQNFLRFDLDLTEERYVSIIQGKTASLYEAACRLGAHYAGGGEDAVGILARYGLAAGTAFQIVDDCLDLMGEEGIAGKSLGTDLAKGKVTLPILHLLATRSEGDREQLRTWLVHERNDDLRRRIQDRFPLAESIAYSLGQARGWIEEGIRGLDGLPDGDAVRGLRAAGDYMLSRKL